jgi:hypothetical protein
MTSTNININTMSKWKNKESETFRLATDEKSRYETLPVRRDVRSSFDNYMNPKEFVNKKENSTIIKFHTKKKDSPKIDEKKEMPEYAKNMYFFLLIFRMKPCKI